MNKNNNNGVIKTKRIRRRRMRGKYKTSLGSQLGPIYEKGFLLFFYVYEVFDVLVKFCEPFLFNIYHVYPALYKFIMIEVEFIHRMLRHFPESAFILLYVFIIRDKFKLLEKNIYNNYYIQYYAMHYLTMEIGKNFLYGIYKRLFAHPNTIFCKYFAAYFMVVQTFFYLDSILCILTDRYVNIQFVTDSVFLQIGDKRKHQT